jgi:hypothetical protein
MPTYSTNPLYNYLNVQIILNDNTNKYYFPDVPQLRDAKIQAMSFYPNTLLTKDYNNVSLLDNTVSNSDTQNAFLTLYSGNKEAVQNIPLYKLINLGNSGSVDGIFTIDNLIIDFSKSFVSFPNNYTIAGTFPISVMFGIFYIK